jgi:hypothetical protein
MYGYGFEGKPFCKLPFEGPKSRRAIVRWLRFWKEHSDFFKQGYMLHLRRPAHRRLARARDRSSTKRKEQHMGAEPFMTVARGDSAEDAFWIAVEQAARECGHGGYSGTIAEKSAFIELEPPGDVGPFEAGRRLVEEEDQRISDKWGPAGVFPLGHGRYLFFGWASS